MTVAPETAAGLLVIAVDRLPAWILPAYGATWVAMPALDRLAARGVVFDRLITTAVDPLATLRQLVGGMPFDGIRIISDDGGITTADVCGTGCPPPQASVIRVPPDPAPRVAVRVADTAIARLMERAIAAVVGGERRVLCHVSSLGALWDAPEEYRGRYVDPEDPPPPRGAAVPALAVMQDTDPDLVVGYRQVFAGQLTLLDEQIGRLIDAIDAAGDGWTVLVLGIRGLQLGLHGWLGTGEASSPFGEVIHVPAILVDAAGRMAGQRYAGLSTPADLGATVSELIGRQPAASREVVPEQPWSGRSLAGLFESWTATARDRVVVAGEGATAVVTPSWQAVLCGSGGGSGVAGDAIRVFAKPDDYFERVDVADRRPAVAEWLQRLITYRDGDHLSEAVCRGLWLDPSLPGGDG